MFDRVLNTPLNVLHCSENFGEKYKVVLNVIGKYLNFPATLLKVNSTKNAFLWSLHNFQSKYFHWIIAGRLLLFIIVKRIDLQTTVMKLDS